MRSPLAGQSNEPWRALIDWYGGLIERGAVPRLCAGALGVHGPDWLLTPLVQAALRRHEPMLVGLMLRADTPAVAWRVAAMADDVARRPWSWNLKARHGLSVAPGACRSCGDALPATAGATIERVRCADCTKAAQLVLRRLREGDLA